MMCWTPRFPPCFSALLGVTLLACQAPLPDSPPVTEPSFDIDALVESSWDAFGDGEATRALDGLERAATLYADAGRREAEIDARIKAAVVVSESGALERGIERYRRIIEQATADGFAELAAEAWILMSRAQAVLGEFTQAHASLDRGATVFAEKGSAKGAAQVASTRAYVFLTEGRLSEAIQAGEEAISRSEDAGLWDEAMRARSTVAYALQQSGDDERARKLYLELREHAWKVGNQRFLQFVYCNLAEINWRQGQTRPAEDDLREVIDGLEATRSASPATPDERAVFLGRQVDAYDRLIRLLADTYRGIEGFEVAERFHALSLLESLQAQRSELPLPELRAKEAELLAELGALRLATAGAAPHSNLLRQLEAELAGVRVELWQDGRDLVAPQPPTMEDVQAELSEGEVLVAYWVSGERLMAWALTPEKAYFVAMPISRQRLEARLKRYLAPLRSPQHAEDAALTGGEGEHIAAGRELYDWLIAPIEAIADADVLIMVPDDLLHNLPFESLIEGCDPQPAVEGRSILHSAYRHCRYLGLQKSVAYAPSAGVFVELRQRRSEAVAESSVLAMAPAFDGQATVSSALVLRGALPRLPLENAAREATQVAGIFAASTREVGKGASEARFKAEASRHRYLHLATHGLVDDATPMVSGLLLEPGDGEDGLLQAHEVLGLRLQSDLVTLSACRSGRGELQRGEGIVGLSRSFLVAGASSVLVSQWDVDDRSTPDLMVTFYQHLIAGASRAEALRAARQDLFSRVGTTRLAFRERPVAYAHPRFWSAFVLIGAP